MIEIRALSRPDTHTVAAYVVTERGSTDVWSRSADPIGLEPEALAVGGVAVGDESREAARKRDTRVRKVAQRAATHSADPGEPVHRAARSRCGGSRRGASSSLGSRRIVLLGWRGLVFDRPQKSPAAVGTVGVRGFDIPLQDTAGSTRTLEHRNPVFSLPLALWSIAAADGIIMCQNPPHAAGRGPNATASLRTSVKVVVSGTRQPARLFVAPRKHRRPLGRFRPKIRCSAHANSSDQR